MATIKRKTARTRQFGGFSPFGNTTSLVYSLLTNSTGAVIDSDSTAAIAVGDVIDLGELPEGMQLEDAQIIVSAGMTEAIKGNLGFTYTGSDSVDVPQDASYFIKDGDLETVGRVRANGSKLITLPKPARLILTVSGAANAKASEIQIIVTGELKGPR
ncbi:MULTISPECIES: hypothetical protein [Acinetobacter]|uniref:hypothetical protein n=1 Tax=Acinetobacter TaxID=469 RepID=UPI0002AEB96A|nr:MULTISPECIES: hypothetical protein [Acinetobacter]ELW85715.1 hypothetical protein ACINWC743_A0725 [Acinetobacter sp. WC-743]MBJ8427849.1 hypothetical protein [Acinetobacter bereziniae]